MGKIDVLWKKRALCLSKGIYQRGKADDGNIDALEIVWMKASKCYLGAFFHLSFYCRGILFHEKKDEIKKVVSIF